MSEILDLRREEEILLIVDVLEGGGLPSLIVSVASEENKDKVLGEVLAEALKVGHASLSLQRLSYAKSSA